MGNVATTLLKADGQGVSFSAKLAVVIRDADEGHEITRRLLTAQDFYPSLGEQWSRLELRQGRPDTPLSAVSLELSPILSAKRPGVCAGLAAVARSPNHADVKHEWPLEIIHDAAAWLAQQAANEGLRPAEASYRYELVVDEARSSPSEPISMSVTLETAPLEYVRYPLDRLRRVATAVNDPDEDDFPVFYTRVAFERAEKLARAGAEQQPAVETGAVLIGTLGSCPTSGEFFVVISDSLELIDAEERQFSLSLSGKTWLRIRNVLKSRQAAAGHQPLLVSGQAHGHNFTPPGQPCELCATAATCGRDSVWVSQDDVAFTRSVLPSAPWALCHIFGFNARGEHVQRLYSWTNNRLLARGFSQIEQFPISE